MSRLDTPSYRTRTLKFFLFIIIPCLLLLGGDILYQLLTMDPTDPDTPQYRYNYYVLPFIIVTILIVIVALYYYYHKNKYIDVLEDRTREMTGLLEEIQAGIFRPSEACARAGKYSLFYVLIFKRDAINYTLRG